MFNCIRPSVAFQEVPDHISLCFSVTGCKVGCKGCHSYELWRAENGSPLDNDTFKVWLSKYHGLISCVLFFGGEWNPKALIDKLVIAKEAGLATALYSGEDRIDASITQHLTYFKTGAWVQELGGLDSPTTNQQFIEISSGANLNHLFT